MTEVSLRTQEPHQLAGYVGKYLGPVWRRWVFLGLVLETYGVLAAFIVAEGQVLAAIFGGSAFGFSLLFFCCASAIAYFGLRVIAKLDLLFTLTAAMVIIMLAFTSWSFINFENFLKTDWSGLWPAYGVVLFSFLGVAAVPQMRLALTGSETKFARAVVCGLLIPMALYLLFTFAVLGVTGSHTTQIATVGLGQTLGPMALIIGNLLAALTMTTAFLGGTVTLKETFVYDFRFRHMDAWLLTITVPIILFVYGLRDFIGIISFVGAVLGGALGVALVFTWWQAEKLGDRQPEFSLPHKKFFGSLLISVFLLGMFYTLLDFFRG
jgi:amino acid permease